MSAAMPCALVRWCQRMWAPVHQNPDTVLYGEYRGETVLLVPQMCQDRPWLVEAWIPDPEFIKVIDQRNEAAECRRRREDGDGDEDSGYQQPDLTGLPEANTPPDLPTASDDPRDFNPAGVGGL